MLNPRTSTCMLHTSQCTRTCTRTCVGYMYMYVHTYVRMGQRSDVGVFSCEFKDDDGVNGRIKESW